MIMTFADAMKRAERQYQDAWHTYANALETDCRNPAILDAARKILLDAERQLTRLKERSVRKT